MLLPGIDATVKSLGQTKSGIGSILICLLVVRSLSVSFCFRNHALHFSIYCCSVNGIAIPYLQKIQSDGESGRKKD
jgi:preprotein translocase subunit SecY